MKKAILCIGFGILMLYSAVDALAQKERASTGITFRMGFWNMGNASDFLTYVQENDREFVETGGFGGWVTFVSRTSDYWLFEFSLGGFGRAESIESFSHFDFEDEVDATAVVPVLFGVQRDFLSVGNSSDLRPYVAFGGGPYWITDVHERKSLDREEVISRIDPGIYFGGGLHFFLSQKFALNFDAKYHMVNFDPDNDISGLEVGLGFSIMWGKYKPQNGT